MDVIHEPPTNGANLPEAVPPVSSTNAAPIGTHEQSATPKPQQCAGILALQQQFSQLSRQVASALSRLQQHEDASFIACADVLLGRYERCQELLDNQAALSHVEEQLLCQIQECLVDDLALLGVMALGVLCGDRFDPACMHAVSVEQALPNSGLSRTVSGVIRDGWAKYVDGKVVRVLRPALVEIFR